MARTWLPLAALVAVSAVAVTLAPEVKSGDASTTPPPAAVVRTAALARRFAASDALWLKTVQLMGTATYAAAGYPELERWIGLVTELDPRFELPYFFGATMLSTSTDVERLLALDRILERGEATLPESFQLPMHRGFLAYFGRLDTAAAAAHYREAARRPGAPPYLAAFATRLEQQATSCRDVLESLGILSSEATAAQAKAYATERERIAINCIRNRIRQAEAHAYVANGRAATLDELVASGALERAELGVHPPGQCWTLEQRRVELRPCQEQR